MATGTLKLGGVSTLELSDDADATSPTWTAVNDIVEHEFNHETEVNKDDLADGTDEEASVYHRITGSFTSIDTGASGNAEVSGMQTTNKHDLVKNGIRVTGKDSSTFTIQYVRLTSVRQEVVPYTENIKTTFEFETQKRDALSDLLTFSA